MDFKVGQKEGCIAALCNVDCSELEHIWIAVCGQHRTDQGEQIKGWSGSSEYNSMFARKLPKPEKLGNYS